jgi:DNA-binding XRE family transcriptional regulator
VVVTGPPFPVPPPGQTSVPQPQCRRQTRGGTRSFGQHLRGLREAAGLSRAELARRSGVPVSTLRNWEADRGMPGLPAALWLAEALGVLFTRLDGDTQEL